METIIVMSGQHVDCSILHEFLSWNYLESDGHLTIYEESFLKWYLREATCVVMTLRGRSPLVRTARTARTVRASGAVGPGASGAVSPPTAPVFYGIIGFACAVDRWVKIDNVVRAVSEINFLSVHRSFRHSRRSESLVNALATEVRKRHSMVVFSSSNSKLKFGEICVSINYAYLFLNVEKLSSTGLCVENTKQFERRPPHQLHFRRLDVDSVVNAWIILNNRRLAFCEYFSFNEFINRFSGSHIDAFVFFNTLGGVCGFMSFIKFKVRVKETIVNVAQVYYAAGILDPSGIFGLYQDTGIDLIRCQKMADFELLGDIFTSGTDTLHYYLCDAHECTVSPKFFSYTTI
jgi:hypothetical protein